MKFQRLFIKAFTPIISIVLLLASIALLRAKFFGGGSICLLLALAGFIFSIRYLEKSPFTPAELDTLRPFLSSFGVWLLIISLTLISVLYVADNAKTTETDRVAAFAFVGSLILGLLAVWWGAWRRRLGTVIETLKVNRVEAGLLLVVIFLAFALRTIGLASHPYPWSGDEASIGTEAFRILNGEITNYFDTGWSSQPNWSFMPTALTEILFGKGIIACDCGNTRSIICLSGRARDVQSDGRADGWKLPCYATVPHAFQPRRRIQYCG
jgi:hypothetical protein